MSLLGQRADLAVQIWGRPTEGQQTAVGEGDLLPQRLGVAGSTQAGEQPRAIAVVPGATLALDAHLFAGAQPRVKRPYGSAFGGGAPGFCRRLSSRGAACERLAADRAALDEAIVAAEGWHSFSLGAPWTPGDGYPASIPGPTCCGGPSDLSPRLRGPPSHRPRAIVRRGAAVQLPRQVAINHPRALAALVDRPDDQRLTAAGVASGEHAVDGRRVGLDRLHVSAPVLLHAELVQQRLLWVQEAIASSTSCAGNSFSVPATGANGASGSAWAIRSDATAPEPSSSKRTVAIE